MFPGIGPMEMVIFCVIALLLFGKRLPEVARSMGKSVTAFKSGLNDTMREIESSSSGS
jgi:sec-independent protein translocase protein TatA